MSLYYPCCHASESDTVYVFSPLHVLSMSVQSYILFMFHALLSKWWWILLCFAGCCYSTMLLPYHIVKLSLAPLDNKRERFFLSFAWALYFNKTKYISHELKANTSYNNTKSLIGLWFRMNSSVPYCKIVRCSWWWKEVEKNYILFVNGRIEYVVGWIIIVDWQLCHVTNTMERVSCVHSEYEIPNLSN